MHRGPGAPGPDSAGFVYDGTHETPAPIQVGPPAPFSTGNGVGRGDRRPACAATSFSSLTLDIGDQFLVEASTDNQTWTTVLREGAAIGDLSNRTERTLDLNALRNGGRTVYIRMGDSQPPTVGEAGSRA